MPPKVKPRPRQSARKNPEITREPESVDALGAPSPKEALANDDNEHPDISTHTEQTNGPVTHPESSVPQDVSASPHVLTGSPPPRRSVQRLKSALPQNSSNAASNLHVTEGPDSRPTGLKFKPKSHIRRSREEREAAEKAEAERRAARQAAEGSQSTSDRGGHYGRGRGRGQRGGFGDMNRWENDRFNLSHEPSGHLGGSTIQDAATSKSKRGGGFRSGGSGASGSTSAGDTSRVKKEPAVKPERDKDGDVIMGSSTSKPKRAKVKKEEQGPTYVSSEGELDSDGGERVNIEDIGIIDLISSDDEDEEPARGSRDSNGNRREVTPRLPGSNLMPVRIQRQEHVERAVGMSTEASSLTSAELRRRAKDRAEAEGSLFLPEDDKVDASSISKPKVKRKPKDVEFVRDERKWKGVYQDDDDKEGIVKIKDEPQDDRDVSMTERPASDEAEPIPLNDIEIPNTSTLGTLKDSGGTVRPQASLESLEEVPEASTHPQAAERLRKVKGYHNLRSVDLFEEEEEDDILAEIAEITLLKSDVSESTHSTESAASTKVPGDDEDSDMNHEDTYFQKGGREEVFLFQLPPVVPSLREVVKATSKSDGKKKSKTVPAEASGSSASDNPSTPQIKEEPTIKADPDELPHDSAVPHTYTSDSFHSKGGRGGVISIYAKGSIFATMGGMSFEICKEGTGAQLAQELMITDYETAVTKVEDESRWEEKVSVGQRGWAMGQTHPGHVCVPELLS